MELISVATQNLEHNNDLFSFKSYMQFIVAHQNLHDFFIKRLKYARDEI